MRFHSVGLTFVALFSLFSLQTNAQSSFVLTNSNTSAVVTFTNTTGTASVTNGTMIVFEGQLDADWIVEKALDTASGLTLASVQLLTQIKLFDELPASNEVGNVQGAVAALRNGTGSSVGTYYAWGVSNSVLTWMPLLSTNGTPFTVNDGETNYITFVFSYPSGGTGVVSNKIYIGESVDTVMEPSVWIVSGTTTTTGINSVSLLGVGVLEQVGSASGSAAPLSSAISLDVYYASNNVYAAVTTTGEQGTSPIKIYAWINGSWVEVGSFVPEGDGEGHTYRVVLTGLVPGRSYLFMVKDEVGHEFLSSSSLLVRTITVESSSIEMATDLQMRMLTVTFNTETAHRYQVKICADLTASADQWTVEDVRQYREAEGAWGSFTNEFMAAGTKTQIQIPVNQERAFFKIFMLENR